MVVEAMPNDTEQNVTVVLKDRETDETVVVAGLTVYDWTEGNWSCDCNRATYFGANKLVADVCRGAERYVIAEVDPMPAGYTIRDFNRDYPD